MQHHTSNIITIMQGADKYHSPQRVTIVPGVACAVTIKKSRFALPFLCASLTSRRSSLHHLHGTTYMVPPPALIPWHKSASTGRCIYILQTQSTNAQLQAVQLHVRCPMCDDSFWCIVHRVAQCQRTSWTCLHDATLLDGTFPITDHEWLPQLLQQAPATLRSTHVVPYSLVVVKYP